jgi:hypothetical protein
MAKQTFTTGQVLTAAQMTSLQDTAMGGGDTTAKTTSYVLVAADAGTVVAMNAAGATTITVNTALFAAGDTVTIQNRGAGVCTVTAGTATVVTAGSLALGQNEGGILYFTATGAATFYDFVQASGGGGKVLQVVNATYATETTSSTSTYIDSGLSASITPTSATSKVLVIAFLDCQKENNSWIKSKLMRGATDLVTMGTQSGATSSAALNNIGSVGITYQDSPATTSATTYKVQFASASNNAVVAVQAGSGRSSITLMEIGA